MHMRKEKGEAHISLQEVLENQSQTAICSPLERRRARWNVGSFGNQLSHEKFQIVIKFNHKRAPAQVEQGL